MLLAFAPVVFVETHLSYHIIGPAVLTVGHCHGRRRPHGCYGAATVTHFKAILSAA